MNRHSAWVENLFRPLAVGAMAGCIALSLANLIHLIDPTWNRVLFVAGAVLAALEAHYSYRLMRCRGVRGADVTRFHAIEIGTIFILLKIGSYAGDRWVDILADIRAWPYRPLNILDGETVTAFVLALLSWLASIQTAQDLERVGEPPERIRTYVSPRERIADRFFWGGIVLLIIAGLSRLGVATLLDLSHPPVPGLVLNVLVYFLLGLTMLGQTHFTRLHGLWRAHKVRVIEGLAGRWACYSLIFISLAGLIAFLLPTSYTFGLLEVVATIVFILGYIATLLSLILSFLFGLLLMPLMSLFGKEPTEPTQLLPLRFPQPEASGPEPGSAALNWWEILRSLLFWVAALGMVAYVIGSYLHDRPELLTALTSLKVIRSLRGLLAALCRRLTGLAEAVNERLPRAMRRRARRGSVETPFRFFRLGALSHRERILYYYLSVLRRAGRLGLPRRHSQTPSEYDAILGPHLDQARQDMTQLTQAFVEARYSRHTFDRKRDRQVRAVWQQVKAALRALKRKEEER